jgi:hypothetical protein
LGETSRRTPRDWVLGILTGGSCARKSAKGWLTQGVRRGDGRPPVELIRPGVSSCRVTWTRTTTGAAAETATGGGGLDALGHGMDGWATLVRGNTEDFAEAQFAQQCCTFCSHAGFWGI